MTEVVILREEDPDQLARGAAEKLADGWEAAGGPYAEHFLLWGEGSFPPSVAGIGSLHCWAFKKG